MATKKESTAQTGPKSNAAAKSAVVAPTPPVTKRVRKTNAKVTPGVTASKVDVSAAKVNLTIAPQVPVGSTKKQVTEQDFINAGIEPPTAHTNPAWSEMFARPAPAGSPMFAGTPKVPTSAVEPAGQPTAEAVDYLESMGYLVTSPDQLLSEALSPPSGYVQLFKKTYGPGWTMAEMTRKGNVPLVAEMRLIWNQHESVDNLSPDHELHLFDVHSGSATSTVIETYAGQRINGRVRITELGTHHYAEPLNVHEIEVLGLLQRTTGMSQAR